TQPSQLTPDPPWMPVFLPEKVTLTCQGSGAPGPTDWYINKQLWWRAGSHHLQVSKNNPGGSTYECRGPGAGLSPPVTLSFSNDWLVLQVPAQALLEGDALLLRCRAWKDTRVTQVQFFREQEATVGHIFPERYKSAPVTVAVQ
ncbi:PREDICTED: Fc receptor-like B, partial [Fulmarus glacialis]|uniref:Fc receptor-like B n=1 Tax=Fulmarus glacialis TaxID=30455 RepID=UPI00051B0127